MAAQTAAQTVSDWAYCWAVLSVVWMAGPKVGDWARQTVDHLVGQKAALKTLRLA